MMCGGLGDTKPADENIHAMVKNLESELRTHAGDRKIDAVKAISYRSQVVAGTNYFIKVNVGDDRHAHLRVFKPLPHTGEQPKLVNATYDHKLDDAIEFN